MSAANVSGYVPNRVADSAGMRPLTPTEAEGYAGINGDPRGARIADVQIYGAVDAELVLDDEALGVHYADPNDDLVSWQVNAPRYVLELIAAEIIRRSADSSLDIATFAALGLECVVGNA